MEPTIQARAHLKLVDGDGDRGRFGSPVVRVPVGPGEWVLALLTDHTGPSAVLPTRELLSRLKCSAPSERGYQGPAGKQWLVKRVMPTAADPEIGPAVLHHSSDFTVLYCRADLITTHAAESLGGLGAHAARLLGLAATHGTCQVSVARVRHGDLPTDLHPAVMTMRGRQVTAHVCSRLITRELAAAMSTLCTAYAGYLATGPTTLGLRWAAEPGRPESEEQDAAERALPGNACCAMSGSALP